MSPTRLSRRRVGSEESNLPYPGDSGGSSTRVHCAWIRICEVMLMVKHWRFDRLLDLF